MKLNLIKIVEPCERTLLSSVFTRLSGGLMRRFHWGLNLTDGSLAEITDKTSNPDHLVRRFGCEATLLFYEEDVLPALRKLSPDERVWRARYEVCCQVAQLRAKLEPMRGVNEMVEEMIEDLPGARFTQAPGKEKITPKEARDFERENAEARSQIRNFLVELLAETADLMLKHKAEGEASKALRLLDRLGGHTLNSRQKYAEVLWRAGDRSPSALKIYSGYLDQCGWKTHLTEMAEFVAAEMSIDEQTPHQEIPERLTFNQFALCGKNPPPVVSRHAGFAYLRLKEPKRALGYLRQAQSMNGADGGLTHFYLGQALFDTEEFGQAAEAFEKATSHGFSRSRVASWQGVAYAKARDWEKALTVFRVAESELGEVVDSEFYLQWGRASFLMKDSLDAEQRFRAAVRQDGASWRAAYCLAVCLEQQGRSDEAIELLRATSVEFNNCAPVFHFLGRLLEAGGSTAEAAAFFRRAVSLSPSDTEYQLSLGLALSDLSDPEGPIVLERVARAGVGGPEVIRRLVLGLIRAGDRLRARFWLRKLATDSSASHTVVFFNARDRISEATEAFNGGRYDEAAKLFEQVAEIFAANPQVRERLALALARDAARRIAEGETENVWDQIERAHSLDPTAEVRFLFGFSCLVRGDARAAMECFSELVAERPECNEYQFFNYLSAYFCGDEKAIEMLAQTGPVAGATNLNSLLAFLQAQLAAARGAFEEAGEKIKAWAEDQSAVRGLGLPARQINLLAAFCMMRGAKQRKQRVVRTLETLNEQYGDNYWDMALTLANHIIATDGGMRRVASAEPARLEECDAAYRRLLDQSPAEDRRAIARHYSRMLRYLVGQRIYAGNIAGALEALDAMADLPIEMSVEAVSLRKLLVERMREPSHEKAYALIESDPDGARAVWQEIHAADASDSAAIQHLACLAWSRAFDQVVAGRVEESLAMWGEGLEWYRKLFDRDDYWNYLREKGRLLGQMPGFPFNEQTFEKWRGEALYEMAHTLIDLISFVMAGYEAADKRKKEQQVSTARSLMKVIRDSNLPA